MIRVENIDVWGFEHAIRGMRNPLNSWNKSDTEFYYDENGLQTKLGENDLKLMRNLYSAGTEHRKYLRQIMVSMDVTAPLYLWKQLDTYKVGTVSNSCSTMHKIADHEFTLDDFSHEHLKGAGLGTLSSVIARLNLARKNYLDNNDDSWMMSRQDYWWEMIQLLPSSYNQKRTITMNYENVVTIIKQRSGHRLTEWREFIDILKTLPHLSEIMMDGV